MGQRIDVVLDALGFRYDQSLDENHQSPQREATQGDVKLSRSAVQIPLREESSRHDRANEKRRPRCFGEPHGRAFPLEFWGTLTADEWTAGLVTRALLRALYPNDGANAGICPRILKFS